jgi:hypothetical protein
MRRDHRITALICSAVIVVLACASPPAAAPSAAGIASAPPVEGSTVAPGWPAGAPDAWLLVGKAGQPRVQVMQASTGESHLEMPLGAAARADWLHAIVTSAAGARTNVSDIAVQPGLGGPEVTLDGAWRLPTIGYDPMPVGLSADGSTAVLVEATPAPEGPATVSRFAVLGLTPLEGPAQIVELSGLFEYDAISSNGKVLYVVEHLPGEGSPYQVRAIDLPAGTMRATIIADKRNLGEAMAGWPIGQLRSPDGLAFTLYNGLEHPFIHALNTMDGWAVCIDLPADRVEDQEAALHWGLAASSDWRTVYAANAALGRVVEVNVADLSIRRSALLDSAADGGDGGHPSVALAKFGHAEGGPVGRRTVVAPDGRTAYAAGPDGIVAVRTSDLAVRTRMLEGSSVEALGLTPDGRALFALLRSGGRIVALDPTSGAVIGQVAGEGFDRLLAVVPW